MYIPIRWKQFRATSGIEKNAQSKQSPIGRKFDQCGHPGGSPIPSFIDFDTAFVCGIDCSDLISESFGHFYFVSVASAAKFLFDFLVLNKKR
jgi:hypothetical protein